MTSSNYPWVESPFFSEILEKKNLSDTDYTLVTEYQKNGFVVVKNVIRESLIDCAKNDAEQKGFVGNLPPNVPGDDTRVQDLWRLSDACKELACHPEVLRILKILYDRKPIPFQTLNFNKGTQQRAHSDTIHFSSLPAKFMCGVWVALEDITEDNGPVFYYSGSHHLPEYNFAQIKKEPLKTGGDDYRLYEDFLEGVIRARGLEKKTFLAKKGDLLIWSSNIIHGGSPVLKTGSSRWSQVTHYFFEDCIFYTPLLSNMVTNELFIRKDLESIETLERVEQSYNGFPIKLIPTSKNLYILNNNPHINKLSEDNLLDSQVKTFEELAGKNKRSLLSKIFKGR